ncbi:recombinase family protein, partial [Maritalea sp.]|uniref:recombinase family protein n=1 Tax=Maritalea sp. TaxID=2003361 RepID=UPI003EF6696D
MGVPNTKENLITALIYCRVSTTKQKTEGSGLESQEHRCRQYAEAKGYDVEMVFPDDASGGGDFLNRPGMRAMLAYLEAQEGKPYVIIFDDLKRFARDTKFHWMLREEFARRGALVECLNYKFEDSPEGVFVETVFAAQGQLERQQNRRQVIQKMTARVEKGYWVFHAPIGYKFKTDRIHGKLLEPNEPIAGCLREALEGYAAGRFRSQAEVQRFLESKPDFPKDQPNGKIRAWKITKILKNPIYAGYVQAKKWGVSLRKGHHEPLISFAAYEQIQRNLVEGARPAARADFNEDFPLRGFVECSECGNGMTGAWSKGCRKHYAYYRCVTRGCSQQSKSVPRAKFEAGFEDVLKSVQPSKQLIDLAIAMFKDAWNGRLSVMQTERLEWKRRANAAEKDILKLVDRILETESQTVQKAIEAKIEKLEREKIVLVEKAAEPLPNVGRFEECIELALQFLSRPWDIYKNGSFAVRQTVLRLVFSQPLTFTPDGVYGTIKTTLPFKVLGGLSSKKCEMVLLGRIELPTSPLPRECSTSELQ